MGLNKLGKFDNINLSHESILLFRSFSDNKLAKKNSALGITLGSLFRDPDLYGDLFDNLGPF